MQIAVVDLLPKPTPRLVEVGALPSLSFGRLLYIPVTQHVDLASLHSHLKHVPAAQRRAADAFVLRLQASELGRSYSNPGIIQDISHRLDDRRGFALKWEGEAYGLTPLQVAGSAAAPGLSEIAKAHLLRALRRAETSLLLDLPGAVLPESSGIHYEGPNGSHYRSFARPGLALRTMEGLDAVSFWLHEYLRRPTTVLLDSWSMLSLGLKLKLLSGGTVKHIDSLRNYHEPADLILGRLLDHDGRFPERVLLLLSVSSTGTLARRLGDACKDAGCQDLLTVSLFGTDSCPAALKGDVFCPLGPEFAPASVASCESCKTQSVVVKIEATNYLMEVSATAKEARITHTTAQQPREFLNRYRGLDYLSVHRDQHDKQRHHMVHLDVARLADSPAFQSRVRSLASELRGQIDIILVPNHNAAHRLADQVSAALDLPADRVIVADDHALHTLPPGSRGYLERSRGVLIVDDVVITGDRFWSYRNALERSRLTAADRPIHFLVGVDRTPNSETLQGVRDAAHGAPHFHSVESLTLPNWDRDECPWCWEARQLKRFEEALSDYPEMRARYDRLNRTDLGLNHDLFLHWGSDGVRPSRLGPNSRVYGDLAGDVEVFVGVASAIQRLRSSNELSEHFTPPAARILNPELTVVGRYYASVLVASTLRATRRHDLRSTASDVKLSKMLSRRLRGRGVPELRSELLMAMARERLPLVEAAVTDRTFLDGAELGVGHFLRLLLQIDNQT